ncbi:hypothetical protein Zmor_004686 [Zophobas morio]|uniref:Endonuclease/exonuclease/phosphatase domain-containing protein n=1 Tax=Zophobas morio TaxID=2755281 RepID=A0AA38IWF3_9CUCU|nr:hypothetical protein Zmor_004686 [Zophobas morio]
MSSLETFADHCTDLKSIFEQFPDFHYIIAGDFNLPNLVWDGNKVINDLAGSSRELYNMLNVTYAFLNLNQVNQIPNNRNVFLDLIFTHLKRLDIFKAEDPIFDDSHHHIPYSWSVDINSPTILISQVEVFDFANGDYALLNDYLASINWDVCFQGKNLNDKVLTFYDILFAGITHFIPTKILRTGCSSYPRWFNKELIELYKTKKSAHSAFQVSGNLEDYLYFKSVRSRCKELNDSLYASYIRKVDGCILNDPTYFWKFIKSKKDCNGIPNEMFFDEISSSGGQDISNLFADFFSSVYDKGNNDDLADNFNFCPKMEVNDGGLRVTNRDVFDYISVMKSSLSPGPDGIPSFLLKKCICTITLPLCSLFESSLA